MALYIGWFIRWVSRRRRHIIYTDWLGFTISDFQIQDFSFRLKRQCVQLSSFIYSLVLDIKLAIKIVNGNEKKLRSKSIGVTVPQAVI